MGISRDSRNKRKLTGGRMSNIKKKRVYEQGRPPAMTKLGEKRIKKIRVRGGNYKFRALRLNTGNYNWGSEAVAFKTKILNVVYNASNNELVRTNTLVKNTIVRVDATPFRQFIKKHYYGQEDKELDVNFKFENKEELKDNDFEDGTNKGKIKSKYLKRRVENKIEARLSE